MTRILFIFSVLLLWSCSAPRTDKLPVHAWMGGPGDASDEEIAANFADLKSKGIDALMYNGGHNPETYQRVGKIARETGLELHAWIPTMLQRDAAHIDPDWYGVNGLGESALEKPAYVDYYTFLCPNREGTYNYIDSIYEDVALVPEVSGIHLDYIRFPDVILARGLWDKYGLVMDREYPQYDYCYCDKCVSDFEALTGINIKEVEDPSTVEEWKQFRYDLITNFVNRLAEMVHSHNKQISAAVFPGPNSVAKKIVRQEWDKWNLDAFYPMNYNDFYLEDPAWVGEVTNEGVTAINDRKPLYSGLFICPNPNAKAGEKDPENHGLVPEELDEAVRESMSNGAAGICLFTPGRMTPAHWEVLDNALYKSYSEEE